MLFYFIDKLIELVMGAAFWCPFRLGLEGDDWRFWWDHGRLHQRWKGRQALRAGWRDGLQLSALTTLGQNDEQQ